MVLAAHQSGVLISMLGADRLGHGMHCRRAISGRHGPHILQQEPGDGVVVARRDTQQPEHMPTAARALQVHCQAKLLKIEH